MVDVHIRNDRVIEVPTDPAEPKNIRSERGGIVSDDHDVEGLDAQSALDSGRICQADHSHIVTELVVRTDAPLVGQHRGRTGPIERDHADPGPDELGPKHIDWSTDAGVGGQRMIRPVRTSRLGGGTEEGILASSIRPLDVGLAILGTSCEQTGREHSEERPPTHARDTMAERVNGSDRRDRSPFVRFNFPRGPCWSVYAVVGCNECDALWIVEGNPQTTGCPRCGKRHQFDRLKKLVETEDEDRARQARGAMLASRQGHPEAIDTHEPSPNVEDLIGEPVVGDEEYLEAAGLDPDEVAAAGAKAKAGQRKQMGGRETILAALRELDAPTDDELKAYARKRDVSPELIQETLPKLVRAGLVTENQGRYRLI